MPGDSARARSYSSLACLKSRDPTSKKPANAKWPSASSGASVIAWLVPAIHEVPAPSVAIGAVLVLAGIVLALGRAPGKHAEEHEEAGRRHAG